MKNFTIRNRDLLSCAIEGFLSGDGKRFAMDFSLITKQIEEDPTMFDNLFSAIWRTAVNTPMYLANSDSPEQVAGPLGRAALKAASPVNAEVPEMNELFEKLMAGVIVEHAPPVKGVALPVLVGMFITLEVGLLSLIRPGHEMETWSEVAKLVKGW